MAFGVRAYGVRLMWLACGVAVVCAVAQTQTRKPASPPGSSATQVGGRHDEREGYVDGKWIEIRYGRPIKRGRDLFGRPDFADALNDGAPVWRAGANVSTRFATDVLLTFGGKRLERGEYTVFIDLSPKAWTLILSTWPIQTTYDERNKTALWGAYDYTPDRDVVRVPMKVEDMPFSLDQFAWEFLDMTDTGGRLAMMWDKKLASVVFTVAK